MAVTRPPFDPELEAALSVLGESLPPTLDLQKMFEMREAVPEEDPRHSSPTSTLRHGTSRSPAI